MKRTLLYILILLHSFGMYGQNEVSEMIEKAKNAMANQEYEKARRILEGTAAMSGINTQMSNNAIYHYLDSLDGLEGKYDHEGDMSKIGLKFVVRKGKCGYVNDSGRVVLPIQYDYERGDYNKKNYLDHKTPQYSYAEKWNEGTILVRVKKNKKYGLVNRDGIEVVPTKYDMIYEWYVSAYGKLVRVRIGDRYGIINSAGEEIVPVKYKDVGASDFEGLSWVKRDDDKIAYVNFNGDFVTDFKYSYASQYFFGRQNKFAQICVGGTWGYIDQKGNEMLLPQYDSIDDRPDKNGLVAATKNGKLGFFNVYNPDKEVIPFIYDVVVSWDGHSYMSCFRYGVANVRKNGKWGLIDNNGNSLTQFVYDKCNDAPYKSYKIPMPMCKVEINGEERFLDFKGNEYKSKEELKKASINILMEAANSNNSIAMECLSDSYEEGVCVEKDPVKAYEWCKKAVEYGDYNSLFSLAKKYYYGKGCTKNYSKAYDTFLQSINYCGFGSKLALYYVAWMNEFRQIPNGPNNIYDGFMNARPYYIKAAMQGDSNSIERLKGVKTSAILKIAFE